MVSQFTSVYSPQSTHDLTEVETRLEQLMSPYPSIRPTIRQERQSFVS